jgi:membrane associated rhomboid family serine protease
LNRLPELDGDADGVFERLVAELVVGVHAQAVAITPDRVDLRLPGGARVVVVRYGPHAPALLAAAASTMRFGAGGEVVHAGGPDAFATVEAALPGLTVGGGVTGAQITDDRRVLGSSLARTRWAGIAPLPRRPDWDAFWDPAPARAPAVPVQALPVVTIGIAVAIGVTFLVQTALGATDDVYALVRLGALVPSQVLHGAWWRLGASMFLHGGVAHIGMNLLAFLSLGPPLERALGRWRYAALYAIAGLGGGVAATVLQSRVCVGASGAIWGLMTAQLVLAWRLSSRMSPEAWLRIRNRAVQSLVLNVMISLVPGIAWSAHLGGGVAGGLIALGYRNWQAPPPRIVQVVGAVASAFVGAGLVYAVATNDVAALSRPPEYVTDTLVDGRTVEIPRGLVALEPSLYGEIGVDPVYVVVDPGGPPPDEITGMAYSGEHTVQVGGVDVQTRTWTRKDGLSLTWAHVEDPAPATAMVYGWTDQPWGDGIAERVVTSIRGP